MDTELPYIIEYSKSSRASCKICKNKIEKDCLRMGVMVQSTQFDGKFPVWHHSDCFFKDKDKKVKTTADIANFDNIRWEDQKKIKDQMDENAANNPEGATENSEFLIEYAKSSRSSCRDCGEKIKKGDVRIAKIDTKSTDAQRYGPILGWRHADCFVKNRQDLGFTEDAEMLPGFKTLSDGDKEVIREKLQSVGGKRKNENDETSNSAKKSKKSDNEDDEALEAQNKLLYDMRDKLKANLSRKDMVTLLEHNNHHVPTGESNILDQLSDCLIFGALKLCPECKNSRPYYKFDGYHCSGDVTEWAKCQYVTTSPEREEFKIPETLREKYKFLQDYKYEKRERLFPSHIERSSERSNKGLPLEKFRIAVRGQFRVPKEFISKQVKELGGIICENFDNSVSLCISTTEEVAKGSNMIAKARTANIHVVSYDFLEAVKKGTSPAQAIKENLISSWGDDPLLKFSEEGDSIAEKDSDSVDDHQTEDKDVDSGSG
ncbi:poly [ADP-ribose] polymerase 1-like isoform X1 [Stegodyphus dumicola]|uniref:poly [ADP-ribose] polymerase 1-like isoform X1 n=2 Tax=Stegodyphus dumicola TaxID=202533 RepID=UPI0015AF4114|nr:poly [ADP-ribose] polymerase 1-like isoform X1 [Stegodyphus dumicola]